MLIGAYGLAETNTNIISIANFWKIYSESLQNFMASVIQAAGNHLMQAGKNGELGTLDALHSSYILRFSAEILSSLSEGLYNHSSHTYANKLCKNQAIIDCLQGILLISTTGSNSLFSTSGKEDIDKNLNLAKEKVIGTYHKYSKYLLDKTKETVLDEIPMFAQIFKNSKILIESLYKLCTENDVTIEKLEEHEELKDLIVSTMRHLSYLASNVKFFEIFSQVSKNFIINVIMPFLTITQDERDCMVDNPMEFTNAQIDLCYRQVNFSKRNQINPKR